MSFDIYIGEARLYTPSPDLIKDGYVEIGIDVDHVQLPEAPSFPGDEMTGNGNSRHPGYGTWHSFVESVGLQDLFFDNSTGIMSQHPGAFMLTKSHYDRIRFALDQYREGHPKVEPGWCRCRSTDCSPHDPVDERHRELDSTLARLIWLEWWVAWALKNCKIPAIYNH